MGSTTMASFTLLRVTSIAAIQGRRIIPTRSSSLPSVLLLSSSDSSNDRLVSMLFQQQVSFFSSFGDDDSPSMKRPQFRILRPPPRNNRDGNAGRKNNELAGSSSSSSSTNTDRFRRPHFVTLFPGDFGDIDSNDDNWKDDDDFISQAERLRKQQQRRGDDDYDEEDTDDSELDDSDIEEGGGGGGSDPFERMVQAVKYHEEEVKKQKERWIANAIPPIHTSAIDHLGRSYGRGGRKTASARVWIQPSPPNGHSEIVVNQRPFEEYFDRLSDRDLIVQPLVVTETIGRFDVQCIVEGGGLTGQAGAVRHGLSNALNAYDPSLYRAVLKKFGFLTRDARKVERKKIGHKKARKSPQWVRR